MLTFTRSDQRHTQRLGRTGPRADRALVDQITHFCLRASIGAGGVERIIELDFNKTEKAMFEKSVAAVQSLIDATNKIVGRA